jgi:uncharacterized cofD-like protein
MTARETGDLRFVALGGGHGLYASLAALRQLSEHLTAIVTVADDGGSSGRLRDELHVPPPGDLRMALAALCEDTEWGHTWRDVLQHRFSTDGPLDGHALGNLLIAGLWSRTGDVVEGLEWVSKLLRSHGIVLPLAQEPLEISALVEIDSEFLPVHGQVAVATAPGRITRLWLRPEAPAVPTQTLDAIRRADVVALGPGSWYSSVLPHFLVAPVARELVAAGPRSVLSLNIAHLDYETEGTGRVDDVRALQEVAPDYVPGVVIVDKGHADDPGLAALIDEWGSTMIVDALLEKGTLDRHDAGLFAEAYRRATAILDKG